MENITNKQLQRMIQLMGNKKPINENVSLSSVELIKKSPKGGFYGIVKENKKYYIKESNNGTDFNFIGGVGNMSKNQYPSYEEAVKRLNLMLEDTNVLTPDIIEEKKFVIKTKKKKKSEKPVEDTESEEATDFDFGGDEEETEEGGDDFDFGGDEEETEEGGEDEDTEEGGDDFDFGGDEEETEEETEEGGEDFDFGGEDEDTEEGGEEITDDESDEDLDLDSDDHIKSIQRLTGKLGQKLRDTEDLSSDTMKWVTKSIISALDLDQMDGEDKKDIIRAIKKKDEEGSDEEMDFMGDDFSHLSYEDRNRFMYDDTNLEDDYNTYDDDYEDIEEVGNEDEQYFGDEDYMDEEGPLGGDEDYPIYDRKRGGELLLDDDLNEPYDYEEDDSYPGMGTDWMDDIEMNPTTAPKPQVAPVKPGTQEPTPSRRMRPFTPPPHITPGEEPAPKARYEDEYYGNEEAMDYMSNDVMDRLATYEQEMAFEDIQDMAIKNGMDVEFCHKDRSKDVEEQTVYLDLIKNNKTVAKIRINSVGDIEMGHMLGKVFKGEPVDSYSDFDEVLHEKRIKMSPTTAPKPQVAPVKPGTKEPTPSRRARPFTPPPHITPGEEPAPKARFKKIGGRY